MECLLYTRHGVRQWRENDGEGTPLASPRNGRSESLCTCCPVPCTLLGLSAGSGGTEKWAPQIKDEGEKQTGQGMFSEQLLCVGRCS